MIRILKIFILFLTISSLLTGIFTGWYRLGIELPMNRVFIDHGAIMTGSFLGTLILIERITTLKKSWLYFWPFINALSIPFFYLGFKSIAFYCLLLGSIGLTYVFYIINAVHENLPNRIMWLGAFAWLTGNLLLLFTESYAYAILWWMAFLLLTIAGERLDLMKFLPVSRANKNFLLTLLLLFVFSCALPFHFGGQYFFGFAMLIIALWFLRFDMIRKTIRQPGIHRFTSVALLFGFIWLGVCGLLFLLNPLTTIPYDALIHSFFLGFIFSMIFAHAPIILPGVVGLAFRPYHFSLYIWLVLLQLTLAGRIISGLFGISHYKMYFGFSNGVILLLFLLNLMLISLIMTKRSQRIKAF